MDNEFKGIVATLATLAVGISLLVWVTNSATLPGERLRHQENALLIQNGKCPR